MIQILPGTWHLRYSTFPMWQKEGVHSVTFNYTGVTHHSKSALLDKVRYYKREELRTVTGYDHPDATDPNAFGWRGKGLLWFLQSRWRVEWMSDDRSAIIISFEKTIATPAGVDILTRGSGDVATLIPQAQKVIAERQLLSGLNDALLPVR